MRLALFDLRESSGVAGAAFKRVRSRLRRPGGDSRFPDCKYRSAPGPQFVFIGPDPTSGAAVRSEFEPQHLRAWWRAYEGKCRQAHVLLPAAREFLHAAWALRQSSASICIPVPGGGVLSLDPRSTITYEFHRSLAHQSVVKAALLATAVLRHDLKISLHVRSARIPLQDALMALRDGQALDCMLTPPLWPDPAVPQMDIRWEGRGQHVAVHVAILGVRCGMLMLEATGGEGPFGEFNHYTSLIDSPEELLYPDQASYDEHRAVHLHGDDVVQAIQDECRAEARDTDSTVPPQAGNDPARA